MKLFYPLLIVSLLAQPVFAQDSSAAEESRKKFEEGIALANEYDYAAALVAFEAAYRLSPRPSSLFNAGMCLQELHRYTEAIDVFRRFLEFSDSDEVLPAQVQDAHEMLATLERSVGRVTIEGLPAGADVLVDGRVLATTPLTTPLVLDPGDRIFAFRKAGYLTLSQTVTIVGSDHQTIRVALEPLHIEGEPSAAVAGEPTGAAVSLHTQPSKPTIRPKLRVAAWSSLGLAIAAGAIGGYYTYTWNSEWQSVEQSRAAANQAADGGNPDEYEQLRTEYLAEQEAFDDRQPRLVLGVWLGFGLAGVFAITSALLGRSSRNLERESATGNVAVYPAPGGVTVAF